MIRGPPEIMLGSIDLHENLVEVPPPLGVLAEVERPSSLDLSRKQRPKSIDPKAGTLMAGVYPALSEKVLHVPERQWKADIHHHGQLDDSTRRFEVAKRVLVQTTALAH